MLVLFDVDLIWRSGETLLGVWESILFVRCLSPRSNWTTKFRAEAKACTRDFRTARKRHALGSSQVVEVSLMRASIWQRCCPT